MSTETTSTGQERQRTKVIHQGGASEAVYGLGLIGAWFYYFSTATTFWIGVIGFFKGIFWPAFLVYEALKYFNM
jgi:hypothetical protein